MFAGSFFPKTMFAGSFFPPGGEIIPMDPEDQSGGSIYIVYRRRPRR